MLDSLIRFVDPVEYIRKKVERHRQKKAQPPGVPDDEDVTLPPPRPQPAKQPLVCRVCKYEGGPEHRFCPRCLAETMERRR
ncbi:MAG TPA: hypothetical protein VF334_11740 [Polyangia bacterium]